MQAVIMAAGKGTRLKDRTANIPKALVKVLGKELLLYDLEFLNHEAVEEIIVVVGYLGDKIKEFLNAFEFARKITVVENPEFEKGNILSLMSAFPHIADTFLLMNADHIYYNPRIFDIVSSPAEGITAICDFDRELGDDDMKVLIENEKITKISKKLEEFTGGYVGMTVVPRFKLDIYMQMAEQLSKKYEGNVHVEQILQALADAGEPIYFKDISNLGWAEVDNEEDLKKAENKLKAWLSGT